MSNKDAWNILRNKLLTVWLPVSVFVLVAVLIVH